MRLGPSSVRIFCLALVLVPIYSQVANSNNENELERVLVTTRPVPVFAELAETNCLAAAPANSEAEIRARRLSLERLSEAARALIGQCGRRLQHTLPAETVMRLRQMRRYDATLQQIPGPADQYYRELWFQVDYSFIDPDTRERKFGSGWVFSGYYPHNNIRFESRRPVSGALPGAPIFQALTPGEQSSPQQAPATAETRGFLERIYENLFGRENRRRGTSPERVTIPGGTPQEDPLAQAPAPTPSPTPTPDPSLPLPPPEPPGPESSVESEGLAALFRQIAHLCNHHVTSNNLVQFLEQQERLVSTLNSMKNSDELENYLRCYQWSSATHNQYIQRYRAHIRHAAESVRIPEQLLTCLLYRESQQFNPDFINRTPCSISGEHSVSAVTGNRYAAGQCRNGILTSASGARGMGQFMENTFGMIETIARARLSEVERTRHEQVFARRRVLEEEVRQVRERLRPEREVSQAAARSAMQARRAYDSVLRQHRGRQNHPAVVAAREARDQAQRAAQIADRPYQEKLRANYRLLQEAREQQALFAHAQLRLSLDRYRQSWDRYFTALAEDPDPNIHQRWRARNGAPIIPRDFGSTQAYDFPVAIAATAVYLRYIIQEIDRRYLIDRRPSLPSDQSPEFLVDFFAVVAGLYNSGPGAAATLAQAETQTVLGWRRALARRSAETRGHMDSVRNCLQSTNTQPPAGSPVRNCRQAGAQ